MTFEDLLLDVKGRELTRFDVVITFLAVLEMCRLNLIRVYQTDPMAMIHIELRLEGQATNAGSDADQDPAEDEA
jgi:segregation and condensation protein A